MKSLLALLIVAFLAAASAQTNETIVEVLAKEPLFSQVYASLEGKAITSFLNDSAVVATLLAPVNQANSLNLTNEQLSYHVLNGTKLNVSDITEEGELYITALPLGNGYQRVKIAKIANSTTVAVGPNKVALNVTGLEAVNGAIYGVESLIELPEDIDHFVSSTPTLSALLGVQQSAGLHFNASAIMLFAPINSAFDALTTANPLIHKYLTSASGKADLQSVLKLHLVNNVIYSNNFTGSQSVTTDNGEALNITRDDSGVTVGNGKGVANVVTADNLASNGVTHTIDKVLIPENFQFDLSKALLGLGLTSFESALRNFNLTQYLGNSAWTLFAPTNNALAGTTSTAELLKYHIVEGSKTILPAGLLQSQLALPSDNSAYQQLLVQSDAAKNTTTINGVAVPAPQTDAGLTGVIYVLDTVLTPPSKTIVATASARFAKLASAIALAGLTELQYTTVFAPVDNAFTGPVVEYLLLNTTSSNADLKNVLNLHIAAGREYYYLHGVPTLPATIASRNTAENITISTVEGTVYVNNKSKIVEADFLASDGVIHGIDSLLLPTNFAVTNDKVVQGFKANEFLSLLTKNNLTNVLTATDEKYTIFTFTDAAYDSAPQELIDNPSRWPAVLKTHVYNGTIETLVAGQNYTMLSGEVLEVVSATAVRVRGAEQAGTPKVLGGPVTTSNGVVYSIDGILTVKAKTSDDSGLSDTAIGFIVIGCIVGVLLIIGAAGGGYWYYKRRAGYEQIGDNAF